MTESGEGQLIPFNECVKGESYVLVSKEGRPFTISDDVVADLVDDYLCNQEEVADENGRLSDLAAGVDYSEITKKINDAFSVTSYFYGTDLKLLV